MLIYGFPGDSLTYLRDLRLWRLGGSTPTIPSLQIIFVLFTRLPVYFLGEIAGYFLAVILVFSVALASFFFLLRRHLGTLPVFFSSLLYGTSLYIQWNTMVHFELGLAAALLPLFLLSLCGFIRALNNCDTYGLKSVSANSLLSSFSLSLIFLSSFYIGYFSLITSSVFLIFLSVFRFVMEEFKFNKIRLIGFVTFFAFFLFFTLPATAPILFPRSRVTLSQDEALKLQIFTAFTRSSILDLQAYGARPWDYLAPSIYHPVFGTTVRNFYQYLRTSYSYQFWSTFLPERANYLTFTGMGLALYALWIVFCSWRRKQILVCQDDLRNISLLLFIAVIMFLVSMPAVINFKGFTVYLPSFFLFKIFPMFRVYARAGVFVLLSVSVLAGYGLKFLLSKIKNDGFSIKIGQISLPGRKSVVLTTVLCGIILFENLNFPPFPVMDVGHVPQVYAWLKNQPGDLVIIEYPKDNSVIDIGGGCPSWLDPKITRDYNGAYTAFYQTIHGKKTFAVERLSKEERVSVASLALVGSYQVLKKYGVSYVLVHTKDPMIGIHPWPYPQENPLDECWQRRIMKKPEKVYEGFKKVAEFDDGVIYRVQ